MNIFIENRIIFLSLPQKNVKPDPFEVYRKQKEQEKEPHKLSADIQDTRNKTGDSMRRIAFQDKNIGVHKTYELNEHELQQLDIIIDGLDLDPRVQNSVMNNKRLLTSLYGLYAYLNENKTREKILATHLGINSIEFLKSLSPNLWKFVFI